MTGHCYSRYNYQIDALLQKLVTVYKQCLVAHQYDLFIELFTVLIQAERCCCKILFTV